MLNLSFIDHCILGFDGALKTLAQTPQGTGRPSPAECHPEANLTAEEKRTAGGFMRVNHAGEIAAQGLYQGQALTARLDHVRENMEQAAEEEGDHLLWCEERLKALGTHRSYLSPLWYGGSVLIGAIAGWAGDRWSLGFVAETENQVSAHLADHLQRFPQADRRSLAVIQQMKTDEEIHEKTAKEAGANKLPQPIKMAMKLTAKVMTTTAFWF